MKPFSIFRNASAVFIAVTLLAACGEKEAPPAPLPEAAFVTITPEKMAIENELPGRIESYRTICDGVLGIHS